MRPLVCILTRPLAAFLRVLYPIIVGPARYPGLLLVRQLRALDLVFRPF